ncbi:Acting on ester bonds protein, partial [Scytalidium lignicola]
MVSAKGLAVLLSGTAAYAQQSAWGQCRKKSLFLLPWAGQDRQPVLQDGFARIQRYSQCLQGTGTTITTTTTIKSTTSSTSTQTTLRSTSTPTGTPTTSSGPSTTISGGSGPGATLQSGYYWIRAVESPNFHKYLQTDPEYTTGIAIMSDYTTAGQFNIVSGQLVELITGGQLYANVEVRPDSTTMQLAVTFETTPNTYGTFAFQGDAVTWSVAGIDRPNTAAWYVCQEQQLFINLGAYDYGTPTGCADETIHYYNGATAVD